MVQRKQGKLPLNNHLPGGKLPGSEESTGDQNKHSYIAVGRLMCRGQYEYLRVGPAVTSRVLAVIRLDTVGHKTQSAETQPSG